MVAKVKLSLTFYSKYNSLCGDINDTITSPSAILLPTSLDLFYVQLLVSSISFLIIDQC